VGLCHEEGGGHPAEVFERPSVPIGSLTSAFFCLLGQHRQIKLEEVLITLQSRRQMQMLAPGPRYGCLNSYLEEKGTADTNASFFAGLSLELLYLAEGKSLGKPP